MANEEVTRYGIRTFSFIEISYNATHYYGKAWRLDGNVVEEHQIERILTAAEAVVLTEKENGIIGDKWSWREGMNTGRFDSIQDVIRYGINYIRDKWGHEGVLYYGEPHDVDASRYSSDTLPGDWELN